MTDTERLDLDCADPPGGGPGCDRRRFLAAPLRDAVAVDRRHEASEIPSRSTRVRPSVTAAEEGS